MRANIPKTPPSDAEPPSGGPSMELQGIYLRAMQDISARLMEVLPAEESLWQTLATTESLLLEAQLKGASLHDVFGSGGTAAFCQSIVDEYNRDHAGLPRDIPAAHDPSIREHPKNDEPRGGINYHRKRRATALLIVAFSLVFALLAAWYTGLLNYLVQGSAYYRDELFNFTKTYSPVSNEPLEFSIPLETLSGFDQTLYSDPGGHTMTLTEISVSERLHEIPAESGREDEDEKKYQKHFLWCIRIRYSVEVGYTEVSYIDPGRSGTVTLTLADGTTIRSEVSAYSSGASGQGYEYLVLEVLDIPASVQTRGSTLTVRLDPPNRVLWTRTSVGFR